MTRALRPRPVRPGFTVLLAADPPPPHRRMAGASPASRHEALVSLARAVFAEGGRMTVPVDIGVALLVGTVALEYTLPQVAERRGEVPPSPLLAMETEHADAGARVLLAPLTVRGAMEYRDVQGMSLRMDLHDYEPGQPSIEDGRRQRVTPRMVEQVQPTVAVLLSPARGTRDELAVLREFGVHTVVFRETILDTDAIAEFTTPDIDDPTDRLLQDAPGGRWSRPRPEGRSQAVIPYAYLMQRLVAEWTGRSETDERPLIR